MEKIKQTIAATFLEIAEGLETGSFGGKTKVAITGLGSEHGEKNVMAGALEAARSGVEVIYLGTLEAPAGSGVKCIYADCEDVVFKTMESLLKSGEAHAAVAMHYPFPIGVSTVGRAVTPATGRSMFIAMTTGTSSTERVEAMILNTLGGIACAKAAGIAEPKIGILNLDGARQAEIALKDLRSKGYPIFFAESARADGGCVLRGNDVLMGTPDVLVCDSLTGNVVIKMLAAFTSGGSYETNGFGYGPGVGANYDVIVNIISRASGAPLIANAIRYAAQMAEGKVQELTKAEYAAAKKAGLDTLLAERKAKENKGAAKETVTAPPKEVVTGQLSGIDVMDLPDAVQTLWKAGIYAEDGMGCTGPIVRVSEANEEKAHEVLVKAGFIAE